MKTGTLFIKLCLILSTTLKFGSSTDIIGIEVSSIIGQFSSYSASSAAVPDKIPTVYLPLRLSLSVDLSRAQPDSFVKDILGGNSAVLEEWKLCYSIPPHNEPPDCRGLLEEQGIPNIHNLESDSVHIISAWFEHTHDEPIRKDRYNAISISFISRDPYPFRGEWFSHIVGGGELSLSEQYNVLKAIFDRSTRKLHGPGHDTSDMVEAADMYYTFTTEYKLRHDIEQFEHIASVHPEQADWLRGTVIPIFSKVLSRIPPPLSGRKAELIEPQGYDNEQSLPSGLDSMDIYHFTAQDYQDGIGLYYNRVLFQPEEPENISWDPDIRSHLRPDWDASSYEAEYLNNSPHLTVVDGAISAESIRLMRTILEESTVWYETKAPKMGGYVGAYGDDGLVSPVFLKLADEIARSMPSVFKGHLLRYLWAYKYDSTFEGIAVHADRAAVNVNVWLTDDEANLDPDHGGLVIYHSRADMKEHLSGEANDGSIGLSQCDEFSGHANITVPYRTNRFIVFDSSLYHRTDKFRFKNEKYTDRRINLTLLYGSA